MFSEENQEKRSSVGLSSGMTKPERLASKAILAKKLALIGSDSRVVYALRHFKGKKHNLLAFIKV